MTKATTDKRNIAVFIGSPGDLAAERKQFRETIEELNKGFGDGAGITFEALGWEDALSNVGRRSQGVINVEVDRCDVFILVLHRRWGQDATDSPYSSYTEEEFHRALERFRSERAPEIFIFFKRVDPASEADPGPQLQKVMTFRTWLEESQEMWPRYVDDDEHSLCSEIDRHLRAYTKGELPKIRVNADIPVLPLDAIEAVKAAKAEAKKERIRAEAAHKNAEAAAARVSELALEVAKDAAEAALEGKLEKARQAFAKATPGATNTHILLLAFEFYYQTGDVDAAEDVARRWLVAAKPNSKDLASACGHLGVVHAFRGDLDEAEAMYRQSLALSEELGYRQGIANACSNLGNVRQTRGDLDEAETMYRRSLSLEEQLGRKQGKAVDYCNLGLVRQIRGDLDEAEAMYRQSLALSEELGYRQGILAACVNLGNMCFTRGDLDEAETMYRRSLELSEELGSQRDVAVGYSSLGHVHGVRGDLDQSETMYRQSLQLSEELGHKSDIANTCTNLGNLHEARGDLDEARRSWQRSLGIFEELGSPNADEIRQRLSELDSETDVTPRT